MHFRSSESKANQRQVIHAYAQRVRRPLAAGFHFACTDRLMRSNLLEGAAISAEDVPQLADKADISNAIQLTLKGANVSMLLKPATKQTARLNWKDFRPSSNLICKHVNGRKGGVTRRWPQGLWRYDTMRCDVMRFDVM
jgi:hypothetical protein